MQDKDFLGYFGQLGQQSTASELKQASSNIVNTLLAAATAAGKRRASSIDDNDPKAKQLARFQQKYLTGDLGDGMSADLNYTLKRALSGLISDDHTVKRGYFLVAVDVLSRFRKQVDLVKLIKYIRKETKTTATMKNPEVHALVIGQMMCLSAIVDSQLYQASATQVSQEGVIFLVADLVQLYKNHDYTRESLQTVLTRMLSKAGSEAQGARVLEQLMAKLVPEETNFKQYIFQHSDNLSLFLTLRHAYLEKFAD